MVTKKNLTRLLVRVKPLQVKSESWKLMFFALKKNHRTVTRLSSESSKMFRTLIVAAVMLLSSFPVHAELIASVLPSSRATTVGSSITIFASVINASSLSDSKDFPLDANDIEAAAENCRVELAGEQPVHFSFQATDPVSNAPVGLANTPVTIEANGFASFVLTLEPFAEVSADALEFNFSCDNAEPAPVLPGINTLAFSATSNDGPDLIAVSTAEGGDGIAWLANDESSAENCVENSETCGYEGAFALAAINIGASGSDLTVRAETTTGAVLGVCQTDAVTGACLKPATMQQAGLELGSGAIGTYSVFVHSQNKLGFDAANSRVKVSFLGSEGRLLGATSIAVASKRVDWFAWLDQTDGARTLRVAGEVFASTPCNEATAVVAPGQEPGAAYLQLDILVDSTLAPDQACIQTTAILPVSFALPDYMEDHRGLVINVPSGLAPVVEIVDSL